MTFDLGGLKNILRFPKTTDPIGNGSLITARKRSLGQGNIFRSVCQELCSRGGGGGGWYPSMPCRSPCPHPRGELRGLSWGVSRPTPGGLSPGPYPGGGGIPTCTEADSPPPRRRLLLRAVRILLECILVNYCFSLIEQFPTQQ